MSHRHEYSGLWYHLGPFGRQDVHLHPCFANRCDATVVGKTRSCKGKRQPHEYVKLSARRDVIAPLFKRKNAQTGGSDDAR